MPSLEKELMLKEVSGKLEGCPYLFFARFQSLSVNDFASLRRLLGKASKSCFVAKKTLLEKAFAAANLPKLNGMLTGAVVLVAVEKDPQIVAKILIDFAKDKQQALELVGAVADSKICDANFIKELSKLPSRIELIAKVVGGIKAPITGFVLTLRGTLSSLVCVLNEVGKKKGSDA
ncbi:MAG TPA: 50S ribosomal protein L10 [Candidatus Omnitrophota bacterium]|nr:50S ribosomal protein L10 [Candidatus Omnitrophota bacterium]